MLALIAGCFGGIPLKTCPHAKMLLQICCLIHSEGLLVGEATRTPPPRIPELRPLVTKCHESKYLSDTLAAQSPGGKNEHETVDGGSGLLRGVADAAGRVGAGRKGKTEDGNAKRADL